MGVFYPIEIDVINRTIVVTEFFFVGMAIFHIFLILEEQISDELLVENQKSCLFSSNFSKI